MTTPTPTTETARGRDRYLTQMDEMSLADEQSAQTPESDPDTLEVRDDSVAILQATTSDLRRPMLIAGAVAGLAVLLAVGLWALSRTVKGDAECQAQ